MISMIRNKYLTLIGVGLLFTAVSCTDGYEPEPVELVSIDFVFSKIRFSWYECGKVYE